MRFREPLVPADGDPDLRVLGLEDLEARVPRREVILLKPAIVVGQLRLPVVPRERPVGVDDLKERSGERAPPREGRLRPPESTAALS